MICGEHSICSYHEAELKASRLRCRSWLCDDCFGLRLSQLRRLAASGQPCTLITLTAKRGIHASPHSAAQDLVTAWRNIRQRARREGLANKIEFLAVFEATRTGWPHLHILARCPYLPQRWLSQRMHEYMHSPIVDIRKVYNRRHASRYIAKYVSKGPERFDGCKRYWRSQAYATPDPNDHPLADAGRVSWHSRVPLHYLEHHYRQNGWNVTSPEPDTLMAWPTDQARWLSYKPPPQEDPHPWT